jgi:hypothetical protein
MDSARHRTIHRIGWGVWLLFSATIHFWAVLIAMRIPDSGGATSTAFLPVISWLRLVLTLPDEFSPMRNAFTISLLAWMGCGLLLITVCRLNRTIRRSDSRG